MFNQIIILIAVLILSIFLSELTKRTLTGVRDSFEMIDPVLNQLVAELRPLNPEAFDRTKFFRSNQSYTINKKRVYLCMVKSDGSYYDRNFLKYVIIHEMAHVLCDDIGHTDKFKKVFEKLLDQAHDMGVYDKTQPPISNYCGYT